VIHGEGGFVELVRRYMAGEGLGKRAVTPKASSKPDTGKHTKGGPVRNDPDETAVPRPPFEVKGWYTLEGEISRGPECYSDQITSIEGFDATVLGDQIEEAVKRVAGGTPTGGKLELKLYPPGKGSEPPVHLRRELTPASEWVARSPSVALLQSENAQLRAQNRHLVTSMVDALGHVVASNVQKDQTIGALATARTVTSASADVSGPWAIAGFVVLFLAFPVFKRMLGIPEGASLLETIETLSRMRDKIELRMSPKGVEPPPGSNGGGNGAAAPAAIAAPADGNLRTLVEGLPLDGTARGALLALLDTTGDAGASLTDDQLRFMVTAFQRVQKDPVTGVRALQIADTLGVDVSRFMPSTSTTPKPDAQPVTP